MKLVKGAMKKALKALVKKKENKDNDKAKGIRVKLEEEMGPRGRDQDVFNEPNGAPPTTITRDFTSLQKELDGGDAAVHQQVCGRYAGQGGQPEG